MGGFVNCNGLRVVRHYSGESVFRLSVFCAAIIIIDLFCCSVSSSFAQNGASVKEFLMKLEGKDIWSQFEGKPLIKNKILVDILSKTFPASAMKHLSEGWGPARREQAAIVGGQIKRKENLLEIYVCKPHACGIDVVDVFIDINTGVAEGLVAEDAKAKWYAPGVKPRDIGSSLDCVDGFACARKYMRQSVGNNQNDVIFDVSAQRAGEVAWGGRSLLDGVAVYEKRLNEIAETYRSRKLFGIVYMVNTQSNLIDRLMVENNNVYYGKMSEKLKKYKKGRFFYPDGSSRECFYDPENNIVAYYLGDPDNRKLMFYYVPVQEKVAKAIGQSSLRLVLD